jgi:hypothetical protein
MIKYMRVKNMKNIYKILWVPVFVALFMLRPSLSYADWNGHEGGHSGWSGHSGSIGHTGHIGHDGGHDHDRRFGRSFFGFDFSVCPDYYYSSPYYMPSDGVYVAPPVYEPVVINGITYYLDDGTYYTYNGYGYQAVAPPETVAQPPAVNQVQGTPTVSAPVAAADMSDAFTINIPNNKGGYTAVTLKKSGNGYIGPQGEFYTEFPTVAHLMVLYGK